MQKKLIISLLVLSASNVSAMTLEQVLAKGYDYDEKFKANRADFLNEIEAFSAALSELMSRVFAGAEFSGSKIDKGSSLGDSRNAITSDNLYYTQSITLEQKIFNGWSLALVSELKAVQSAFRASRGAFYSEEQDNFLEEINIYLLTAEAKKKYAFSKVSIRSNKTQLEAMKEKIKLGESTGTEVASAREGLAKARQALVCTQYKSAKAILKKIFGVPTVEIKFLVALTDITVSLEQLKKKSIAVNPNINSAHA